MREIPTFHGEDFLSESPAEGELPTADELRPGSGLAYRGIYLRLGDGGGSIVTAEAEVYVRSVDLRVDTLLVLPPDGELASRDGEPLAATLRFQGGERSDLLLEENGVEVTLEADGTHVQWQRMAVSITAARPVRGALVLPDPWFDVPGEDGRARHNSALLSAARPVRWEPEEIADLLAKLGWARNRQGV